MTLLAYLTYGEAGRRLPAPKSEDTIRRWATVGLRGVILETVWVGETPCVTAEGLADFFDRLTAVKRGDQEAK
ncbi:hypothetical protein V5E97_15435 [Singulisphaera sp. Ch08]|uniref:Uncharacterized protein n=1 Tax=Singulisphaera sp. Ch08 TaxID=3120278 RepID=A0AAU7CQU0_9BACT